LASLAQARSPSLSLLADGPDPSVVFHLVTKMDSRPSQILLEISTSMTNSYRHWKSQIHHNFNFMASLWWKMVHHRSRVIP
jgi:hypothetical protein